MPAVNKVKLKMGFQGTSFTRTYEFEGVSASALDSVKSGVIAFNESVASAVSKETQEYENYALMGTFVSDDFAPSNNRDQNGMLSGIVEATVIVEEETKIPLF